MPSPIVPSGPVRATLMIVLTVRSRKSSLTTISSATFRKQRRRVLVAAIHLRPPALTAEPLGVADRQPRHLDLFQRLADGVQLGRLDNGDDQFHTRCLPKKLADRLQDTCSCGPCKAPPTRCGDKGKKKIAVGDNTTLRETLGVWYAKTRSPAEKRQKLGSVPSAPRKGTGSCLRASAPNGAIAEKWTSPRPSRGFLPGGGVI